MLIISIAIASVEQSKLLATLVTVDSSYANLFFVFLVAVAHMEIASAEMLITSNSESRCNITNLRENMNLLCLYFLFFGE